MVITLGIFFTNLLTSKDSQMLELHLFRMKNSQPTKKMYHPLVETMYGSETLGVATYTIDLMLSQQAQSQALQQYSTQKSKD